MSYFLVALLPFCALAAKPGRARDDGPRTSTNPNSGIIVTFPLVVKVAHGIIGNITE